MHEQKNGINDWPKFPAFHRYINISKSDQYLHANTSNRLIGKSRIGATLDMTVHTYLWLSVHASYMCVLNSYLMWVNLLAHTWLGCMLLCWPWPVKVFVLCLFSWPMCSMHSRMCLNGTVYLNHSGKQQQLSRSPHVIRKVACVLKAYSLACDQSHIIGLKSVTSCGLHGRSHIWLNL